MGRRIIFLHPDLGLGGAERLVVDAALALKSKGHDVSFVTSYHNERHCFKETADGTLPVRVVGRWIPRHIFGRFFALLAYLKMIYCALFIVLFEENVDVVFCDLVSVCIPVLKWRVPRVVFYCHFPDQLLSKKEGRLKDAYRWPLNWLEERTIRRADKLYVNSEFTKGVFEKTFGKIRRSPVILYPSINTTAFDELRSTIIDPIETFAIETGRPELPNNAFVFVSINRFERKKNLELAVNALKIVGEKLPQDADRIILVIAGGCDPRVEENVSYYDELARIVKLSGLDNRVYLFKSPSDKAKVALLSLGDALVYTPPNEHFGIVPLEAMYFRLPVIACNSGGPTETVVDGWSGFLCELDSNAFADAMARLVENTARYRFMGKNGEARFLEKFSFEAFSNQLNSDIDELFGQKNK